MAAPLYEALIKYVKDGIIPFHMPGHKQGRLFPKEFLENIAKIDLTEVPGTDNLHDPHGPILEAEKLAAKAFGAKRSFFLVNGTTCGIYAAMCAVLNKGDKVLLQRNSHKSVYNGLILTKTKPIYLSYTFDYEDGIAMGIDINELENVLKFNNDIKAVIITYPNYYGFCVDIEEITKIVHRYNKILIVDEAHGAHFAFSEKLPITASAAGADIVVESIHKTLPAFTQSSILHVNSDLIDINRLKFFLSMFQTTSPSYILMASIDIAREYMTIYGKSVLNNCINYSLHIRDIINKDGNVRCIGREIIGNYGIKEFDPTKLTINFNNLGISGLEAEKILREKFNIQIEMSDIYNILAIVTVADEKEKLDLFLNAIREIYKYRNNNKLIGITDLPNIPDMVYTPSNAIHKKSNVVNINMSIGRISQSFVIPYPPGIPIICPGEVIKKDMVQYINLLYNKGIRIIGIDNFTIRVCE